MAARPIGNATISFGLVSIPVRLYVATHSEQLSFNQIHEPCGSRIKQQIFCPKCERVWPAIFATQPCRSPEPRVPEDRGLLPHCSNAHCS